MDPVTAVGLVASVAQLIQVTLKSIEFLSGVNHASEDQPRFFQEACNVLHVLNALSRLVQSSQNETGSNGIRSLDVTNGPLDQLREALGMIIEKLQPAPGVKKIFRAAKWPFDKKQCIEILGRMERAKSSIGLVLQIDKMFVSLPDRCTC